MRDLRAFFWLCNFFRQLVSDFVPLAAPPNKKLQVDVPKIFKTSNDKEREGRITFQEKLISLPILVLPYTNEHYTLDKHVCKVHVSRMLFQEQPNMTKRPIGNHSRALTKAEKAYVTIQREYLELDLQISLLRPYRGANRFTIRTNHDSRRWILNLANESEWRG